MNYVLLLLQLLLLVAVHRRWRWRLRRLLVVLCLSAAIISCLTTDKLITYIVISGIYLLLLCAYYWREPNI